MQLGVDTNENNRNFKKSKDRIDSKVFEKKYKKRQEDFTRKRKISFKDIILFQLGTLKKTLALEIHDFIEKADKEEFSKQAYSEARQKVEPEAFKELNEDIVEGTYEGEHKTYEGYVLLGIDGATEILPNTKELKKEYGEYNPAKATEGLAMGRISVIYDVLNEIVLEGKLTSHKIGEIETAEELIGIATRIPKSIILMDRGYPKMKLIKIMADVGLKYVIRLRKRFLKETDSFIKGSKDEEEIEIIIDKKRSQDMGIAPCKIKIRCIKIELETQTEYLITNLTGEEIAAEKFKDIYSKRWKIETNYNIIKNVLELGNFTGETKTAIEQDFYATIYLNNVANIAINEAQEEYDKKEKKETKHKYKINRSVAIGHLKRNLIEIYLCESPRKRKKMLKNIFKNIQKHILPERENRKQKRNKRSAKFSRTHKRVM